MFPLREGDTEGQRIDRGGPRLLVNVTVADCDGFWYSRHMQSADSEAFCTISGGSLRGARPLLHFKGFSCEVLDLSLHLWKMN